MPSRPALRQLDAPDLLHAAGVVRRYLIGLAVAEDTADDVVQETMARLWENRWRVDRRTAPGYAISTARSLLADTGRQRDLDVRHQHRLYEPAEISDGASDLERAQEHAAVLAAIKVLPERDRELLVAHHVDEVTVADLARAHHTSPGALAAALNRARGRLRLEYCLQAYGRGLPDGRCRQVLTAVALGEKGRQESLGAGRHLVACEHCGPLATVITTKDRHRAGLGPLVGLVGLLAWLRRTTASHPAGASAAAATTAGATVAVVLVAAHHPHPAAIAPVQHTTVAAVAVAPTTTAAPLPAARGLLVDGRNLLPSAGRRSLLALVGKQVRAVNVPVLAVDADEGFWVGSSSHRLWVQLHTKAESKQTVKPGDVLSFTGHVVANPARFATTVGVTAQEDRALLQAQRVHVEATPASVHIASSTLTAAATK